MKMKTVKRITALVAIVSFFAFQGLLVKRINF